MLTEKPARRKIRLHTNNNLWPFTGRRPALAAYFRPDTLTEALGVAATGGVTIAAGCTDLLAATRAQTLTGAVLDLTGIAALRGIDRRADHWRIGAATRWSDLIAADLPPAFDGLKAAAREVGSAQIQNAGTLGGNLCNASPAADGVPSLLTLDARVELQGTGGTRELPLARFLTGVRQTALMPGEIMTAIVIPDSATQGRSSFVKLGARRYLVISIVMVAARLVIDGGRVRDAALAVGACSTTARRLPLAEAALIGQPADADLAMRITGAEIAPTIDPITDIRADAGYREHAALTLIRRAVDRARLEYTP